jgi:hypothetical protein
MWPRKKLGESVGNADLLGPSQTLPNVQPIDKCVEIANAIRKERKHVLGDERTLFFGQVELVRMELDGVAQHSEVGGGQGCI